MKKLVNYFWILTVCFLITSCAAQKTVYVPTEAVTKIERRDSTIYIRDTVFVNIPTEQADSKTQNLQPSHLETSVATSDAWVEGDKLHHTLKNKPGQLKTKIDTVFTIKFIDRYQKIPVIQEVEVEKPYIPKLVWVCIGWTILCIGYFIGKLIMRFKGK